MNSDEYFLGENDRAYVSPTVSRDEQMTFIDNLRNSIGQENQRVATQTEQLGTAVPSDLGGLGGSSSYFQQRYQTAPVENTVAQLRATAQAKALNDLMSNYEAQAKNRYQQAYRSARRGTSSNSGSEDNEGGLNKQAFEEYASRESIIMPTAGWPEGANVTAIGSVEGSTSDGGTYGYRYYRDSDGHVLETDNPDYAQSSNGYYYNLTPYLTTRSHEAGWTEQIKRALADRVARSKGEL